MTKTWVVFKALMKNTKMFGFTKNRLLNAVLLVLVVIGLIPLVVMLGFGTAGMYQQLASISQEGVLIALILVAMNISMFFFGAFYILNVFYFSKDIESLLFMPFKASHILMAKLLTVVCYEYMFVGFFYVPIIVVYGVVSSGGPIFFILAALIGLMLPFIPLIAAALIVMVIMRFTNVGKHKELVGFFAGIAVLVVTLGFNFGIQRIAGSDIQTQDIVGYMTTNNGLMSYIARFFPGVQFSALVLSSENFIMRLQNLAIYSGIMCLAILLFLWVANKIYFAGAVGLSDIGAKRQRISDEEWKKTSRKEGMIQSVIRREWRLLLRSPVYFMNGILTSVLLPGIFVLFYLVLPNNDEQMQALTQIIQQDEKGTITMAVIFAAGVVLSGMNAIASTAITREGRGVVFLRFLPIKTRTFYIGKGIVAMVLGYLGVLFVGIVIYVIGGHTMALIVGGLLAVYGVGITAQTGLCIDMLHPKLDWDNEQQAMKQNMNVLINMLVGVVVAFVSVYIPWKFDLSFEVTLFFLAGASILLNSILYSVAIRKIIPFFERQDY